MFYFSNSSCRNEQIIHKKIEAKLANAKKLNKEGKKKKKSQLTYLGQNSPKQYDPIIFIW